MDGARLRCSLLLRLSGQVSKQRAGRNDGSLPRSLGDFPEARRVPRSFAAELLGALQGSRGVDPGILS